MLTEQNYEPGRNILNFLFKIKELCKVNALYLINLVRVKYILRTIKLELFKMQRLPRKEKKELFSSSPLC